MPERHTAGLRDGLQAFALPLTLPAGAVSMLWHSRMHADPHAWLRDCLYAAVAAGPRRWKNLQEGPGARYCWFDVVCRPGRATVWLSTVYSVKAWYISSQLCSDQ